MRFVTLLAGSVLVTGCTSVLQDPYLTNSIAAPSAPTVATEVSPEYALALLPSVAGLPRSVRQQVQDQHAKQEIIYENPTSMEGENSLTVEVGLRGSGAFPMRAPSEATLMSEMRAALPGVAMTISPIIGQNGQGVYGYATGAFGASGSCIYAWQYIKDLSGDDTSYLGSLTANGYSSQVRLRYCTPSIGQQSVVLFMQGLRVKPVTPETFGVLKFAIGSSVASRSAPVVQSYPVEVKYVPKAEPVIEAADPEQMPEPKAPEVKIKNASRVPVPTVEKVEAAAEPVAPKSTIIKKGVAVPLPTQVSVR